MLASQVAPVPRHLVPDRRVTEPARILIVDPNATFRSGIRTALSGQRDLVMVGEAIDAVSAVDAVLRDAPDIVIVVTGVSPMRGVEVATRVKRASSSTSVILLSAAPDDDEMLEAIRAGAAAYVSTTIDPPALLAIVRRVHRGEYLIDEGIFSHQAIASRILGEFRALSAYGPRAPGVFAPLSPREIQILDLITSGMTNRQLATDLGISEQTIKNHVSNILRKLSVNDRTQAVVYALREGWIAMPDGPGRRPSDPRCDRPGTAP